VRLLRSWPARIPAGRAYVVDDIPKLVIDNHHYGPLGDIGEDVLLLEWDNAVGQEDLCTFARQARQDPERVLVAPYRIYADAYGLPADIWAHRRWDGTGEGTINPIGATTIQTGDPTCNLFGLGMVWLPWRLIQGFLLGRWAAHFGDQEFSMWHYSHVAHEVPVCWDVRPVHLNYRSFDLEE
jgi:hypothetical protein